MKAFLSKNIFAIGGLLIGAAGGYAYWYFVGCQGGSCPIYSIWYRSTAYGAVMGTLLGMIVADFTSKKSSGESNQEDQSRGNSLID